MTARRRLFGMIRLTCLLVQVLAFGIVPAPLGHAAPKASVCCEMTTDAGAPCAMTGDHDGHRHGPPCCHAHVAPSTIALPASLLSMQGARYAIMRLPLADAQGYRAGADGLPPRRPPRSIDI